MTFWEILKLSTCTVEVDEKGKNKRNKLIKYGEWVQRLGKGWEYTH
jgi:hypothetical protein